MMIWVNSVALAQSHGCFIASEVTQKNMGKLISKMQQQRITYHKYEHTVCDILYMNKKI